MMPLRPLLMRNPSSGYAYWRLYVTNNNGGTTVSVGDITFKDAGGSTISATGGTAGASSVNSGSSAANAFDGDVTSPWLANVSPANEWVSYHFTSPVAPTKIVLYTSSAVASTTRAPKDCIFQYSSDGSTWSDAFSFTGYLPVLGYGETYPYVAPASGYHRAWRVFCVNNNGDTVIRIDELEFRATAGGADQTAPVGASSDGTTSGRAVGSSGTPASAFDGTTAPWTSSTASNEYVGFIFGNAVKVEEISVKAGTINPSTRSPKDMLLQYSDDGITWTTQKTFASQTGWTSGEVRVLTAI